MRKFTLSLPGPFSYCKCARPCSQLQLDHVIPKVVLKKKCSAVSNNDLHNLYSCCSRLNLSKSALILGKNYFIGDDEGRLARACLYMNYTYKLKFPDYLVSTWKNMSLTHPPKVYEIKRAELIKCYNGKSNIFIEEFPYNKN